MRSVLKALPVRGRPQCVLLVPQRWFHQSQPRQSRADPDVAPGPLVVRLGSSGQANGVVATIFGAGGLVGTPTVSVLARTGSTCICPYRGDGFNMRGLKILGDLGQVVPVPCDIRDEDAVRKVIGRSNVVINLIGKRYPTMNWSLDDVHVKTSHRIAKIARECGVERFIHLSSLGASVDSKSAWLRAKAHSEIVVREYMPDATIFRCSTIYGAEDSIFAPFGDMALTTGICLINGGQQKVQPVSVDNVANAIFNALTLPELSRGKTFDIAGPEVFSMTDIAHMVCNELMVVPDNNNLPDFVAKLIGRAFDKLPMSKWKKWTEDDVAKSKYDLIVSPDSTNPTLADLGITPDRLQHMMPTMMQPWIHDDNDPEGLMPRFDYRPKMAHKGQTMH